MNGQDNKRTLSDEPPQIGALVKILRRDLGQKDMTQLQLAEKAGVSRSLIARIESLNVAPSDKVLQQITTVFAQDDVEERIILKKLRRSALYSKNPVQFMSAMEAETLSATLSNIDFVKLTEYQRKRLLDALQNKQFTINSLARQANVNPYDLLDTLEGETEMSLKDLNSVCQSLDFNINEFILGLGHYPDDLTRQLQASPKLTQIIATLHDKVKSLEGDELNSYLESVLDKTCHG